MLAVIGFVVKGIFLPFNPRPLNRLPEQFAEHFADVLIPVLRLCLARFQHDALQAFAAELRLWQPVAAQAAVGVDVDVALRILLDKLRKAQIV